MKRLLALLLIAALVGAASATSLNFQNPGDNTSIRRFNSGSPYTSTVEWIGSTTGGNSYIKVVNEKLGAFTGFGLTSPSYSTYAAATLLYSSRPSGSRSAPSVLLLDSSGSTIYQFVMPTTAGGKLGRWEVKIIGGTAYVYVEGVLLKQSTTLTQNPSYIVFGSHGTTESGGEANVLETRWDNYVYGDTENKHILGISESDDNMFIVLDDIINDASDGLAFGINGTQVQSTYMPATWARGNLSTPLTNQTIQLVSYPDNTPYATYYTGDAFTGTINVDIKSYLIDANSPYGYYAMYMPGTGAYSNIIMKKSNGASVSWNQDEYSVGDTGTVIYYVLDGGYWDTSSFSYKVSILDSYMNFKQNTSLTASSGSVTYEWTEDDDEGVYHAWLIATNHDGYEYVLGSDYAELVAFFGYGGFVNDGYTELPIEGANVNITQGLTALHNASSGYDGNYSTSPLFGTGSSVFFNVTKAGYNPYQYSYVPLASKSTYDLNVTLFPLNPLGDAGGVAIGGVIRDITYGRPISGATVPVFNISRSELYTRTTNMAGGYMCGPGELCNIVPNTYYKVNASKIGYNTSPDYTVYAAGVAI